MTKTTIETPKADRIINRLRQAGYTKATYDMVHGEIDYIYMGDKENYLGYAHVEFNNYSMQFHLTVEHNRVSDKGMGDFLKELHDSMFLVNVLNNILNSRGSG